MTIVSADGGAGTSFRDHDATLERHEEEEFDNPRLPNHIKQKGQFRAPLTFLLPAFRRVSGGTLPTVPNPLAAFGRDHARGANSRERGALEGGADGFGTCAAIGIDAPG